MVIYLQMSGFPFIFGINAVYGKSIHAYTAMLLPVFMIYIYIIAFSELDIQGGLS